MNLTKDDLLNIKGGAGISGTVINGIVRGINSFLDLGRTVGSAIRRISEGNVCPL